MSKEYQVDGSGGVRLWVGEWGNPSGPAILFIHGFMHCHLAWQAQIESSLADEFRLIAIDARGHGLSDKPVGNEAYQDGKHWGDDIAAVIQQLKLDKPVLVGWSYGGLIVLDYCQRHGCSSISGINFAAAAVRKIADGNLANPNLARIRPKINSEDLATRIAGVRDLVKACTATPVDRETSETWLAFCMLVPRHVCLAMMDRELDFDPVLEALTVPALVSHGTADQLVAEAMAVHAMAYLPNARISIYQGVGHAPSYEDSERFNAELGEFVRQVNNAG